MRFRWKLVGDANTDLMVFDRLDGILHFVKDWKAAKLKMPEGAAAGEEESLDDSVVALQVVQHEDALHLSKLRLNELNQAFTDVVFLGSVWPGRAPLVPDPKAPPPREEQ